MKNSIFVVLLLSAATVCAQPSRYPFKGTTSSGGGSGTVVVSDSTLFNNDVTFSESVTVTDTTYSTFLDVSSFLSLNSIVSPAQMTADSNNFVIGSASLLRIDTDASRTITGFTGGAPGRILIVTNIGTQSLILSDESTSSTAANRITATGNSNINVGVDNIVLLIYDSVASRWIGGELQ